MEYSDLTEEQKAKARECKTTAELIELAKAEGVGLTDEQLEGVVGGWCESLSRHRQGRD